MTYLFIGVNHISFPQCLRHVLGEDVLLLNRDPHLELVRPALLLPDLRVLNLAHLVPLLDLVLHL